MAKGALWAQELKPSKFAGRMLDQIVLQVYIDQKRGDMVAEEYFLGKRWERAAAREQRSSERGDLI